MPKPGRPFPGSSNQWGEVSPYQYDRNRGAQLPSALSTASYRRIMEAAGLVREVRAERAHRKLAAAGLDTSSPVAAAPSGESAAPAGSQAGNLKGRRRVVARRFIPDLEPATLQKLGARALGQGLYKVGHHIWELRRAEDGDGFLLVRTHEERAVDFRPRTAAEESDEDWYPLEDVRPWRVFGPDDALIDTIEDEEQAAALAAQVGGYTMGVDGWIADDFRGGSRTAVAPPGHEKQVKKLKQVPGIDNPWAVAWSQHNKEEKGHRHGDAAGEWVDQLPGGQADDMQPGDFDPDQLSQGREHELEHVDDPALATEIGMDHLTEDPRYYEHLDEMESRLGSGGEASNQAPEDGSYWERESEPDEYQCEDSWGTDSEECEECRVLEM